MTVHSFHIFDRKGKTLFTKRYIKTSTTTSSKKNNDVDNTDNNNDDEKEQLSEQRKLVFGMLFSLRELSSSLSPSDGPVGDLHLVKTGGSTLYNFETVSGLRFCLYTTPESVNSSSSSSSGYNPQGEDSSMMIGPQPNIHSGGPQGAGGTAPGGPGGLGGLSTNNSINMTSLKLTESIRGALRHIYEHIWVTFVIRSPMYQPSNPNIGDTNFEVSLDNYLKGQSWFRS